MLFCNICGKEVIDGWIIGFPPAPDSQKMALCQEHATSENKKDAMRSWQQMIQNYMRYHSPLEPPLNSIEEKKLIVSFSSGGIKEYKCIDYSITTDQTLQITAKDGVITYVPLRLVKEYVIAPS